MTRRGEKGTLRPRRTKRVCILAEALRPHSIDATMFEPFVIAELGGTPKAGVQTTEFVVTLHNVDSAGTRTHLLLVEWQGAHALRGQPPVQQTVMTEWAACGIACAVLWHYTGLRVLMATKRGERFDYWIGNDTAQQGMEISGTLSEEAGEMQARHQQKRTQLLSYPSDGGYVVIVGFTRREIIISYHAAEESIT